MPPILPCCVSMLRWVLVSHIILSDRIFSISTILCFCVDVVGTAKEHLSYAITLNVPVFVVITKIDLCSQADIQKVIDSLTESLAQRPGSKPIQAVLVDKQEDLLTVANMLVEKSVCPIFTVSSVTGKNIDLLKNFLNILPPRLTTKEQERLSQLPVEFRVSSSFSC